MLEVFTALSLILGFAGCIVLFVDRTVEGLWYFHPIRRKLRQVTRMENIKKMERDLRRKMENL